MTSVVTGSVFFPSHLWQSVIWSQYWGESLRGVDPMHIAWIKSCQHNDERFREMRQSQRLPMELMMLIRDKIVDGFSLYTFDHALNIRPCHSMFCNRLLIEKWYEGDLDVISIAEWEYNKRQNQPPFSIRHQPSYYIIEQTETGFKMITLKKHPYTRYHAHYPIYTDPIHQNDDYLPCSIFSIFDYDRVGRLFNGCNTSYPILTNELKRSYRKIRSWFASPLRRKNTYPGWDAQTYLNPLRHPLRGKCWIYPVKDASRTFGQENSPCIQWTQTLYEIYTLQQTIMRTWMNKPV